MSRPLPNPSAKQSRAGRKRRVIGWTLLTLGLLIAGVWAWSGWHPWSVTTGETEVSLSSGVARWRKELETQRAMTREEVRGMVAEMLEDADTRASLLGEPVPLYRRWRFVRFRYETGKY